MEEYKLTKAQNDTLYVLSKVTGLSRVEIMDNIISIAMTHLLNSYKTKIHEQTKNQNKHESSDSYRRS